MSPSSLNNGWADFAHFCSELAPVMGPLLSTVAETAHAIDRAQRGGVTTQSLPQSRTRCS
jgi:hypothetical protein